MFPEGGIWQTHQLGGRVQAMSSSSSTSSGDAASNSATNGSKDIGNQYTPITDKGSLKWGIGKLIAHSPVTPHIIPFFFMGTETAYPQHPVTKSISNLLPLSGNKVDIRFGKEIEFYDLIQEHEEKYGKLWKYKSSKKQELKQPDNSEYNFHKYWNSKESDYILYNKITLRIENSLKELNKEYNIENNIEIK